MKKSVLASSLVLISGLIALFIVDPEITKTISFGEYSADYEWRIFNNSFCNLKTDGHCYSNETNRINAELELYHKLIEDYKGQEEIKAKLEDVVKNTYRFNMTYREVVESSTVDINSIISNKDIIFRKIVIK